MSDLSRLDEVLARQRSERQRLDAEAKRINDEQRRLGHLLALFQSVSDAAYQLTGFTPDQNKRLHADLLKYLPPEPPTEDDSFAMKSFTSALIDLVRELAYRDELNRLITFVEGSAEGESEDRRQARVFVAELLRLVERGDVDEIANLMTAVVEFPFIFDVDDLLNRRLHHAFFPPRQLGDADVPQATSVHDSLPTPAQLDEDGEIPASVECKPPIPPIEPLLTKKKRSTVRGEGSLKIIAALTKHHRFADGSCLNLEPIGNNVLARLAEVDQATASAFFKKQFEGHAKYKATCADAGLLVSALKLLNGEYPAHFLYGAKPPSDADREE